MVTKRAEKGQALVLIALAAVGLFAFAALALDGSAVFSDRRHAQNAADTGAYAAALAKIRGTPVDWKQAGLDRVGSNGYANGGGNEVWVYTCQEWKTAAENPDGNDCQGLPAGADPSEYVYVRIKSIVNMYFARVIGRQQITNYTDAIVHASPIKITEWFGGNAMVAANRDCPAPGDFGPFDFGGSGSTTVHTSGIFVNSSCSLALVDHGRSNSIDTDTGVCVIGGIQPGADGFDPRPVSGSACGEQIDIYDYWMPDTDPSLLAPYCSTSNRGAITGSGGDYTATPGYYSGRPFPDESPAGVLKLQKGIYCFDDGLSLSSSWRMTTDIDGSGTHNSATEGVFFYIRGGDFKLNGEGGVNLHAMDSTTGGWPSQLLHYLIFVPRSNPASVDISGNSDTSFVGMILAPSSNIDILGSSGTFSLDAQVIGNNVRISGSGTVDITYDPDVLPPAITSPKLSPTE